MIKSKFPIFVFAVIFTFALNAPALACFCIRLPLADSYKKSDAIFSGKVIGIRKSTKDVKFSKQRTFKVEVTEYEFEITESFLNLDKAKTVSVFDDGTNCGLHFEKDKSYLVWAFKNKHDDLVTNSCMPTRKLEEAKRELDFLKNIVKDSKSARIKNFGDNTFTNAAAFTGKSGFLLPMFF